MAMDFSGRIGRVIDNPVEAQSAAMEEGHAWRVRHSLSFYVLSVNNARSGGDSIYFINFFTKDIVNLQLRV